MLVAPRATNTGFGPLDGSSRGILGMHVRAADFDGA